MLKLIFNYFSKYPSSSSIIFKHLSYSSTHIFYSSSLMTTLLCHNHQSFTSSSKLYKSCYQSDFTSFVIRRPVYEGGPLYTCKIMYLIFKINEHLKWILSTFANSNYLVIKTKHEWHLDVDWMSDQCAWIKMLWYVTTWWEWLEWSHDMGNMYE